MGRKKNVIAPDAKAMDLVKQDEHDRNITAVQAFEIYGFKDVQNYDISVYVQKIGLFLQLGNRSIIEAGKGLLVIKTNENHGVFLQVLEQIGIPKRTAQRYMNIARRFGKNANLAFLPTVKLEALCELDDPELEELDTGGDILGLNLDLIEQLPATEVRKRLREAKEKLETQKAKYKKELEEKLDEIKDLTVRAASLTPLTKKEQKEKDTIALLEELQEKLFSNIHLTRFYYGETLNTVQKAKSLDGVTFRLLEEWRNKHYEEIAVLNELFEQLDDELVNCVPVKGNENEGI